MAGFMLMGQIMNILDEQGIVYLVLVAKGNECDEEKNANENTQHSTQKAQMLFFSCGGNVNN